MVSAEPRPSGRSRRRPVVGAWGRAETKVRPTMERRKFLIGAGSAAVGSSALVGSGAVSSITADRDADLRIATDANAYLGLEANPDHPYVTQTGDGVITFNFDGSGVSGNGINNRADTTLEDAFDINNQSDRSQFVWASFTDADGNAVDPTSGAARSVELLANGDRAESDPQRDITFPKDDSKADHPETSRTLGQTANVGAIELGSGSGSSVEMRFLVYGSNGARDSPFRIVFHARDEPEPTTQSEWETDANGQPNV